MGLSRLAALHGVATSFSPSADVTVPVPEGTVVAVLAALGVDAATPEAVREALAAAESAAGLPAAPGHAGGVDRGAAAPGPDRAAARHGADGPSGGARSGASVPDARPRRGTVPAVSGPGAVRAARDPAAPEVPATYETPPQAVPAPGWWTEPPPGVHRLTVRAPGAQAETCTLVVAPARVPQPPGRSHGFLVQLYSLLSARSWGMGDLGDLADLASWSGRSLGAGFVQVNPLHAAVLGTPTDPSPYRPSSRRFPDPVHLHIESVPEYGHAPDPAALDDLRRRAAELSEAVLNKGALIDRDAVWSLKRQALDILVAVPLTPGRRAAYCDFLAAQGQALEDHALWCALAEVHGSDWHTWPALPARPPLQGDRPRPRRTAAPG